MASITPGTTLRELRQAAAGSPALSEPVSALRPHASASLRFVLDAFPKSGITTVGELLAAAPTLRIARWVRDELLQVLRSFVEDGPGPGEPPGTEAELRAWAEAAGVSDVLAWPVRVLGSTAQANVVKILSGDLARAACILPGELERHPRQDRRRAGADAARSFLLLVATRRRKLAARDRQLAALPPPSPALAPIAGRMERLRAEMPRS